MIFLLNKKRNYPKINIMKLGVPDAKTNPQGSGEFDGQLHNSALEQ
jgi:hypothetical protein